MIDYIKRNFNLTHYIICAFIVAVLVHTALTVVLMKKVDDTPKLVEIQIDSAVQKIYIALKQGKNPGKVKTAALQHKGNFYYFEGKVQGKSFRINDNYDYDVTYPNDVWDGYLTYVVANNGTEYYLWSESKIEGKNDKLAGWFLSDGLCKFQHTIKQDTSYLDVIYPIVRRRTSQPY